MAAVEIVDLPHFFRMVDLSMVFWDNVFSLGRATSRSLALKTVIFSTAKTEVSSPKRKNMENAMEKNRTSTHMYIYITRKKWEKYGTTDLLDASAHATLHANICWGISTTQSHWLSYFNIPNETMAGFSLFGRRGWIQGNIKFSSPKWSTPRNWMQWMLKYQMPWWTHTLDFWGKQKQYPTLW